MAAGCKPRSKAITIARRGDGSLVAAGDLSASFGHRIPLAGGHVDGIYAGWRWNGAHLHLEQDRYGFYPLFVWTTPTSCSIASDLSTLLQQGAPRTLDYSALSVMLRVGFLLGSDTPFAAIRAVPPGAELTWTKDGPIVTGRYPGPHASSFGRDEAIDRFIDVFGRAIRRRLVAGTYQTTLSGGRDSRHIVLALVEAGAPPSACVTVAHFPPRAADDIAVAAELCSRLRLRHVRLEQCPDRVSTEREKNVSTHYCTTEHAQFVAVRNHLRSTTEHTYDGIGGDVLSQSSKFHPEIHARFVRGDARAVAEFLLDGYPWTTSDAALELLLPAELYRNVRRDRAIERLLREIPKHFDAPNPTSSFLFWNRTRRNVALSPFALCRGLTVFAPYLDHDVFDLLTSLPGAMLLDRAFHTDAIARAFPAFAAVRYEQRARVNDGSAARKLALQLAGIVAGSRGMVRADTLLPRLAATAMDGATSRLWHASTLVYLDQLAKLRGGRTADDRAPAGMRSRALSAS